MKPPVKPIRSQEDRDAEEAIRASHAAQPLKSRPLNTVSSQSFAAMLHLLGRFRAERERQGLTAATVADRLGVPPIEFASLEAGKSLNPTLATLTKWAEVLGMKLDLEPTST